MFVIVGGFVVLLLSAALVAPLFIDWTGYRATFEAEAAKILGRPVKVAGAASARLLPFPSVTFENVRVGEDVENPTLTIEKFSMDAELAPFLSGEVLIFDMRVSKPRGIINVDKNGVIDWTLRGSSPVDPSQVRIENMSVDGGQLVLIDEAAGRTHTLAIIDAQVSAKALTGPWRLVGNVAFDGEPLAVSVSTGLGAEDGGLPLRTTITPKLRSVVIEADGSAKEDQGKVSYAGQFTLRPATLTDKGSVGLRDGDGVVAEEASEQFRVTGKFGLAPSGLALTEYKLETGARDNPYVANGSGSIIFGAAPMFDLALTGTQVNFSDEDVTMPGQGMASRIATFRSFLDAVPMPTMPGTISVNLPAIVAGDTTVRDIAFAASPQDGNWRVRDFKSTLPGRTLMEADGVLGVGAAFRFQGKLLVASNQPAGLANWLSGQVDPAIRKLEALGFSSDVDLKVEAQTFDKLELAIGATSFKGHAERRTDGERPVLSLTLAGGALQLEALSALGAGFIGADGANRFDGHDVTLSLDAGPVSHEGLEAKGLGVSVRLKQDRLDIDRLMLTDIAGTSISATGAVTELSKGASGSIDAALVSADGAGFIEALGVRFKDIQAAQMFAARAALVPELLADIQASIVASTALDENTRAVTASVTMKSATGALSLAGNFKAPTTDLANLAGSISGTMEVDDPLALVALAGVPVVPLGAPGPGRLEFSGDGNLVDGVAVKLGFVAVDTKGDLSGTLISAAQGAVFSGDAALKSGDLDPYLAATGFGFSGVGAGTPVDFVSAIKADSKGIAINGLKGAVAGNRVAGDLILVPSERLQVNGALALTRVDADWFAMNLFGPFALDPLQSDGGSAAFYVEPFAPIDGRIALSAETALLGPLGEGSGFKAAAVFNSNAVRFDGIEAQYFGGVLSGNVEARNDGGNGAMSGDFLLKDADIATVNDAGVATGRLDVGGSFTTTGKTLDGLISGLAGAGVVSTADAQLQGLNPNGFAPIVSATSRLEKAPSESDVDTLLRAHVMKGSIPVGAANLAWTLNAGKVRVPGLRVESALAIFNADLTADLARGEMQVKGALGYNAGKQSVSGAEPIVPFVATKNADEISMVIDVQPMTQFLSQGVLEREQARVEALQAALVEKQRLRRDVRQVALLYAERERKSGLREAAVRTEAARLGAVLAGEWIVEKARQEAEAKAVLEAEKAASEKAAAEKAAAEKAAKIAAESAAKAEAEAQALDAPVPSDPNRSGQNLEDVFKSLDFDTTR